MGGGNIAGAILKKLGRIGNSIVSLMGGGVGGQLPMTSGGVAAAGASAGGMDMSSALKGLSVS